jgi:hypothetical protein
MLEPTFVPFDAFWLAVAGLLVACAGSLARLRTEHRAVWEQLGRPRLLPSRGLGSSAALTRFYWSRRVSELADPCLTRWVTALRALQLSLAAVLVVLGTRLIETAG